MSDGRKFVNGHQNRTHESRDRTNDAKDVSNHDAPFFALSKSFLAPYNTWKRYQHLTKFVRRSVYQLFKVAQKECGAAVPPIIEQTQQVKKLIEGHNSVASLSEYADDILKLQKLIYQMRGTDCPPRLHERLTEILVIEQEGLAA